MGELKFAVRVCYHAYRNMKLTVLHSESTTVTFLVRLTPKMVAPTTGDPIPNLGFLVSIGDRGKRLALAYAEKARLTCEGMPLKISGGKNNEDPLPPFELVDVMTDPMKYCNMKLL